MAKPILLKCRTKIMEHFIKGHPQREAAEKYRVSKSFVSDLVKSYNES